MFKLNQVYGPNHPTPSGYSICGFKILIFGKYVLIGTPFLQEWMLVMYNVSRNLVHEATYYLSALIFFIHQLVISLLHHFVACIGINNIHYDSLVNVPVDNILFPIFGPFDTNDLSFSLIMMLRSHVMAYTCGAYWQLSQLQNRKYLLYSVILRLMMVSLLLMMLFLIELVYL